MQQCACARCGTVSGFPLEYHLPIALAFGRGTLVKPSRHNQAVTTCRPDGWVGLTASWCHLSRLSLALYPPDRSLQTQIQKTDFGGRRYEEQRQYPIPPLKRNLSKAFSVFDYGTICNTNITIITLNARNIVGTLKPYESHIHVGRRGKSFVSKKKYGIMVGCVLHQVRRVDAACEAFL